MFYSIKGRQASGVFNPHAAFRCEFDAWTDIHSSIAYNLLPRSHDRSSLFAKTTLVAPSRKIIYTSKPEGMSVHISAGPDSFHSNANRTPR